MQQQQLRDLIEAGNGEAVDAILMADRDLLSVRYDAPCRLKRPSTGRTFTILNPTPLMMAVASWFPAVVRLLICWEAHVDDVFEMREPSTDGNGEETVVHFVKPLMVAAMTGRLDHCRALLDGGAQVNARDSLGRTALYHACSEGHLTVVDLLIYESANVEAADEELVTPLMAACANGHTSVVFHLVSVAAKMDKLDRNGQNVLFYAARGGVPSILEYLIDQSDNMLLRDKQQRTLLMIAAAGGYENVVEHLISQPDDYGLSPHTDVDSEGRNALFYAILSKQLPVLKRLFQLNLPVTVSCSGETLLMAAARSAGPEMVQFLVENADTVDLDVQAVDNVGENALFHAAANPDPQVFAYLSKAGLRAIRNSRGATPLMAAIRHRNSALLRHLLDARPCGEFRLDEVDEEGRDALHYAAKYADVAMLQLLTKRGARPLLDGKRQSLLMTACASGAMSMVRVVADVAKFDLGQRDRTGRNLLFHCVSGGTMDALRMFDKKVAREPDDKGVTLVMTAAAAGSANILKYLIDTAPDSSTWLLAEDSEGRNALFYAVASGSEGIVQLLLTAGCPLLPDRHGRTPLMEAARLGSADLVRFFLEHATQLGLDPSGEDAHGHNVIFFAAESGSTEILRACRARGVLPPADGSALMHAARHNSLRFAHHLLDELSTNSLGVADEGSGENALFAALRGGHFSAVKELAGRGVPVRADRAGHSPIAELYGRGETELAYELLSLACQNHTQELLNGRDLGDEGRTTYQHLAMRGDIERLRAGRKAFCADKDKDGSTGATILMLAAANCPAEMVEMLLEEFPVKVEAQDDQGRDALMMAAMHGRLDNLKLLFAYGAPFREAARVVRTLVYAVESGCERLFCHLVKFFLGATGPTQLRQDVSSCLAPVVEAVADSGSLTMFRVTFDWLNTDILAAPINDRGEFVVHVASRAGQSDLLDACLSFVPADTCRKTDNFGNNALHAACGSSRLSFSVVAKLLEAGVDPEAINNAGDTPLQLAVQRRILKAVRLLVEAGGNPWRQNKRGLNAFELCVSENSVIQVFLEKHYGLSNRQRHELDSLLPSIRALDLDSLASDLAARSIVLCEHNSNQISSCIEQGAKLSLFSRLVKRRARGKVEELCARLALHNEAVAHELQTKLNLCELNGN